MPAEQHSKPGRDDVAVGDNALVDVRLFRITSFSAASGLLFLSGSVLYGTLLLVPLYFQRVRGLGAFTAGLLIAAPGHRRPE